jgi:PAS domain S-box-containing protein
MENRFQSIFDHVNEGILIANRAGEVLAMNPMGRIMFGLGEHDELPKKVEDLVPASARDKHQSHRENYHHHPHARPMGKNMVLSGLKKNGETFPVEISLSTYQSEGQDYVIAFIIDVTDRREQEEKIKEAYSQLQQLNNSLEKKVSDRTMVLEEALADLERSKEELFVALQKERELNELKSRFVSTASHEFRTPLSTILSSVSLIEQYVAKGDLDKMDKHINRVKNAVKGLTEILEDILSLSKLEEGKIQVQWKRINLKHWIQEWMDELHPILKKGQEFRLDFDAQEEIFSDHKLLKNVMLNLLSNAVKFSPEDKEIDIRVEEKDGELRISIRDSGMGIPVGEIPHLFQRFHRASNAMNIQGTGLGLSIVKKCTELLGGDIFVESEIGQGTTFNIILKNHYHGKEDHIDH